MSRATERRVDGALEAMGWAEPARGVGATVAARPFFVQSEFCANWLRPGATHFAAASIRRRAVADNPRAMAKGNAEYQPDPVTMVSYHRALADHADSLKAYAARLLGDAIAAEDVAQDAFLALYRHLNQVPAATRSG